MNRPRILAIGATLIFALSAAAQQPSSSTAHGARRDQAKRATSSTSPMAINTCCSTGPGAGSATPSKPSSGGPGHEGVLASPARGGHRATPLPPCRVITDHVVRPSRSQHSAKR